MGGELFEGEGKRRAKSKKEEKEERIVDWSNLHGNILELIADRLTIDIADCIRFRNICKTWHATKPHSGTHPPQLPWLLLRCDYNIQHLIFFSFSDNRFHSIQTPANDKREDDEWTLVDDKTMYHDVIYYEGSFYAVDGTAQ
ncbi:unnamed protein product, partial [Musa acuminata var. zebrina]